MATASKPDLSEFLKLSSKGRRRPCRVKPALDQLTEDELKQFDAALKSDAGLISNQAIAAWLERHAGDAWQGTWQHVIPHRTGRCSCA